MMLRRLILHELKGGEELYLFKILTLTNEGGWARVGSLLQTFETFIYHEDYMHDYKHDYMLYA